MILRDLTDEDHITIQLHRRWRRKLAAVIPTLLIITFLPLLIVIDGFSTPERVRLLALGAIAMITLMITIITCTVKGHRLECIPRMKATQIGTAALSVGAIIVVASFLMAGELTRDDSFLPVMIHLFLIPVSLLASDPNGVTSDTSVGVKRILDDPSVLRNNTTVHEVGLLDVNGKKQLMPTKMTYQVPFGSTHLIEIESRFMFLDVDHVSYEFFTRSLADMDGVGMNGQYFSGQIEMNEFVLWYVYMLCYDWVKDSQEFEDLKFQHALDKM
ncbi:MAG: hypothetical protein CMF22_11850 [Idiomarinaceae bacterium]|nr:hypothetical protein [Idiomarinaceae bacterium]|tara:strand:+ start:34727 stop:35542 length:816 start_codon:yes stop_codon:yes gene_type:complete